MKKKPWETAKFKRLVRQTIKEKFEPALKEQDIRRIALLYVKPCVICKEYAINAWDCGECPVYLKCGHCLSKGIPYAKYFNYFTLITDGKRCRAKPEFAQRKVREVIKWLEDEFLEGERV